MVGMYAFCRGIVNLIKGNEDSFKCKFGPHELRCHRLEDSPIVIEIVVD